MNCPKCAREIDDQFKFCPECGSNISALSGASSQEPVDASLGDLKTMAAGNPPSDSDLSLGDLPTMHSPGEGPSATLSGEGFAERYEMVEEIGRGGFATVWKAKDKKLGRMVAVKRLHESRDGMAVARFRREATSIAQLNHRNIVQVYDVGEQDGDIWLVMELIDGGSLRDLLKQKGKLSLEEALPLFKGIAQGLAYAHRKNLVHRDIKPANILLVQDGTGDSHSPDNRSLITDNLIPKIVDFGLAQAGRDSELSMSGYGMGTPYYMPPEQRRDAKRVSHTADIYALGKVLYEMVTGEIPDTLDPDEIPPPSALAQIVFKCTKPRPEDRYFSVDELLRELEGVGLPAKGRERARKKGNEENSCPACGVENEADARFCAGCGGGLFRGCPECGKENSVNRQFCTGCGTDVNGFLSTQEILQRMEKYADEKKWSRVVKEAEGFSSEVRLPGEKGTALERQLSDGKKQAQKILYEVDCVEKALAETETVPPNEHPTDKLTRLEKRRDLLNELADLQPLTTEKQAAISQLQHLMDAAQSECDRIAAEEKKMCARVLLKKIKLNLIDQEGDYAPLDRLAEGSAEAQELQRKVVVETGLPLEVKSKVVGIPFRLIPAGKFMMGSPSNQCGRDVDEEKHEVTISKPFYCGKFPVTQEQWETVMGYNPASFKKKIGEKQVLLGLGRQVRKVTLPNYPVESVSWKDCQDFLNKLCEIEEVPSGTYRLLSEAQWEYACRAGTMGAYAGSLDAMGWHLENSERKTHSVGLKIPNAWGLYDMHGNVFEWCADWHEKYSLRSVTDPEGPASGLVRINRGGAWCSLAESCRSAYRYSDAPDYCDDYLGLRLLRTVPPSLPRE